MKSRSILIHPLKVNSFRGIKLSKIRKRKLQNVSPMKKGKNDQKVLTKSLLNARLPNPCKISGLGSSTLETKSQVRTVQLINHGHTQKVVKNC